MKSVDRTPGAIIGLLKSDKNIPKKEHGGFVDRLKKYSDVKADLSAVWKKSALYILEGSKHSALASIKQTNYENKKEIIKVIKRVISLYKKNGSEKEFKKASNDAAAAADIAWKHWEEAPDERAAKVADVAAGAAEVAASFASAMSSRAAVSGPAAHAMARAVAYAAGIAVEGYNDYVETFLEILHHEFSKLESKSRRNKMKKNPETVTGRGLHKGLSFDIFTEGLIAGIKSSDYFAINTRARDNFIKEIVGYSRRKYVDYSGVWPVMVKYILEFSEYSAYRSLPGIEEVNRRVAERAIVDIVELYTKGGNVNDFVDAYKLALKATGGEEWSASYAASAVKLHKENRPNETIHVCAMTAISAISEAAYSAGEIISDESEPGRVEAAATIDFAKKLLEVMHYASVRTGRTVSRSKMANPSSEISKCRELWDSYYARPTKRNLNAVLKHLEIMKLSNSKAVLAERARCLRIARKE